MLRVQYSPESYKWQHQTLRKIFEFSAISAKTSQKHLTGRCFLYKYSGLKAQMRSVITIKEFFQGQPAKTYSFLPGVT